MGNIQVEGFSIQLEVFDDVCTIHDSQGVCERSVFLYESVIHAYEMGWGMRF